MNTVSNFPLEVNLSTEAAIAAFLAAGAAGFVHAPVTKKPRLRRRWAHPLSAPLVHSSCLGRPGGRKMHFATSADEWRYKIWASKQAASQEAANIRRANPHGLVQCHISHREAKITVSIGADLVKVKRSGGQQTGGGLRKEVRGFSRDARKRMLMAMAETHDLDVRPGLFLTLTYPDIFPDNSDTWHRDLDVLIKRICRKFRHAGGFWRLEMKVRKSGAVNAGVFAPHFHLLLFLPDRYQGKNLHWLRQWLALAWADVVASPDPNHRKAGTQIDNIFNRAHAMRYCSKYAAKEGEDSFAVGRRWGSFGELDRSVMWSAVISRQAFYQFKRYAAKLLESRGRRFARRLRSSSPLGGFTVFGMGAQSDPGWSQIFDSTAYALLVESVLLARSHPREIFF